MALAHEVRSFFSGKVRLRGHEYFERRAVVIDRGDAWSVRAVVRGTERYQVDLSRGPSRRDPATSTITAWCTCPYAQGGEACKHIWASVLAATAQGLLGGDGHQRVGGLRLGAGRARIDAIGEAPALEQELEDDDVETGFDDDPDSLDIDKLNTAAGSAAPGGGVEDEEDGEDGDDRDDADEARTSDTDPDDTDTEDLEISDTHAGYARANDAKAGHAGARDSSGRGRPTPDNSGTSSRTGSEAGTRTGSLRADRADRVRPSG